MIVCSFHKIQASQSCYLQNSESQLLRTLPNGTVLISISSLLSVLQW